MKYLRKLGPLLSRLRTVGTERDRAGNRRLFMDQYCALILLSLFSPAVRSLRDLQRISALDKVRKRLGVTRASLGSLSGAVAIFDPASLKEIPVQLGHTIRPIKPSRFDAVGQKITAVDGTIIETVHRVANLSWTPKSDGKHLSAYRLHTHFEVLSGKAARIDATSANPRGTADERAVLQEKIAADRCSILDRGYISYGLWNAINAVGSSCACRSSDRTAATVMQANELTDADRAANVISDEIVELGWKSQHRTRPDHPVRLICVAVKPHESSRGNTDGLGEATRIPSAHASGFQAPLPATATVRRARRRASCITAGVGRPTYRFRAAMYTSPNQPGTSRPQARLNCCHQR